jgi:hypothetical protein
VKLGTRHGLEVGDTFSLLVQAGVESLKPVTPTLNIRLYTLMRDQRFEFTYRGSRPDTLRLESVVPRRIQRDKLSQVTVSGIGIPADSNDVEVYVGGTLTSIVAIDTNDVEQRAAIITANVPAIAQAGQYDVAVRVNKGGIWEQAVLHGGLVVDAPIKLESLWPLWGPMDGGTEISIFGEGFEPGNTLLDTIKVRIGPLPARSVTVVSSTHLRVVSAGGPSGRHRVSAEDRYGNVSSLTAENGFGYGLKLLGTNTAANVFSSDVVVDLQSGVALTNGGYLFETHEFIHEIDDQTGDESITTEGSVRESNGLVLPDVTLAASFDIQNPVQPLLVGANSSLPGGVEGQQTIKRFGEYVQLLQKVASETITDDEQVELDEFDLSGADLITSIESPRLGDIDVKDGQNRFVHVASGNGGVTILNGDDLNALNVHSRVLNSSEYKRTVDVISADDALFALTAVDPFIPDPIPRNCKSVPGDISSGQAYSINFVDTDDPVALGEV